MYLAIVWPGRRRRFIQPCSGCASNMQASCICSGHACSSLIHLHLYNTVKLHAPYKSRLLPHEIEPPPAASLQGLLGSLGGHQPLGCLGLDASRTPSFSHDFDEDEALLQMTSSASTPCQSDSPSEPYAALGGATEHPDPPPAGDAGGRARTCEDPSCRLRVASQKLGRRHSQGAPSNALPTQPSQQSEHLESSSCTLRKAYRMLE